MRIYKLFWVALLAALALGPARAEDKTLPAAEACRLLEAEARGIVAESLRCEPGPAALTLRGLSGQAAQSLEKGLFPGKSYRGYEVVIASDGAAQTESRPQVLLVPVEKPRPLAGPVSVDFDNAATYSDAVADPLVGLMGDLKGASVRAQAGPPGSGGGAPPNNGGSTPPSRPAPVWRSSFPPPSPNWWNTDWDHYDWWDERPVGYDRARQERLNEEVYLYYSPYYRWRDVFVTDWAASEDSAVISRTQANQDQVQTRTLTSQAYRDAKESYYRAVYRYEWVQGGYYGSHWEESFDDRPVPSPALAL